jgi:hypothetical protein
MEHEEIDRILRARFPENLGDAPIFNNQPEIQNRTKPVRNRISMRLKVIIETKHMS